jgi:flagellar hook-associated protein 3 FlgL
MKTTFVSTYSVSTATRASILKMQAELAKGQKEMVAGRHADVGLALGARTGQTVSLRQEHAQLKAIADSNGLVSARLDATQSVLETVRTAADDFVSAMIHARDGSTGPAIAEEQARSALSALIGSLNATYRGEYLLSGIDTDVRPVADYFGDPTSAGKQSVDAAFLSAFGVSQADSAVVDITAADMRAFLDGDFAALFDEAGWAADWSSASDQAVRSRISPGELIPSGTTANESAFRKLAMSLTMVADLGAAELGPDAYKALLETAIEKAAEATQEITMLQAQLGAAEARVTKANDRMAIQTELLSTHIGALERVDPYEATTRVNELITQIETAYALTGRIQQLSLLDYL